MAASINVDTTGETATLAFVDDHGNATEAPAGASVEFTSDNEAVATVDAAGNITPVGVGDCNIGVTVTGAMEADGVTPIPSPDPVALHVDPGAAVGERLTVSGPSDTQPPVPEPPAPAV